MLGRYEVKPSGVAVAVEGGDPAHFEEEAKGSFVVAGFEHRAVVISEDRDQIAATSQFEKLIDDAFRVDGLC